MSEEFKNKTDEILQNVRSDVDRGSFLDAIAILEDGIRYMEKFIEENAVDPNWKLYYYENYRNVWRVYKFTLEAKNDLETFKKESEAKIFELHHRIDELEK